MAGASEKLELTLILINLTAWLRVASSVPSHLSTVLEYTLSVPTVYQGHRPSWLMFFSLAALLRLFREPDTVMLTTGTSVLSPFTK